VIEQKWEEDKRKNSYTEEDDEAITRDTQPRRNTPKKMTWTWEKLKKKGKKRS